MQENKITFSKIVGAAVAIVTVAYLLRQFATLTISIPKVRIDVVVETTPSPTIARPTSAMPAPTVTQPAPAPTEEIESATPKSDPGQKEPVAYYPFDGNANDESGNGHHGTVYGATLTTDRFGNRDNAYLFDGRDDYIALPDNLNLLDTDFTLSAWIKPDDYGAISPLSQSCHRTVLSYRYRSQSSANPTNSGLLFSLTEGSGCDKHNYLRIAFFGPDFRASGASAPGYGVAEWFLYSVTRESQELSVYVNGEQVAREEISAAALFENPRHTYSTIGAQRAESLLVFPFDGVIDDVRVYNRALSAVEVERLYRLGQ